MKNNLKLLLCSVLLLVFLLFAASCGGKKTPVQETTGWDNDSAETMRDGISGFLGTHTICPVYPEIAEYSQFDRRTAVIAEFGEPIVSKNSSDGESSLFVLNGEAFGNECEFNVFPIKIHKKFESTAYSDEGFFDNKVMELGIDKTQTYLNLVLDYPNKDEIMDEYDDIILITSTYSEDIVVGEKYLFLMSFGYTDYPHLLWDEYNYDTAIGWMPESDEETNRPGIILVKDDKICLPENFYEKQAYPDNKYYIKRMARYSEEANEMLKKLGLTDNLFRDGMTIDELDEYFNLVTNKETFAPLFEGVETQEP